MFRARISVNQGLQRYDATWSIDNPTLANITTASPPVLTATAAGTVTLTATVGGVSAQMPVTISSLASFPDGTILWSAPTASGFVPVQLVQAIPTEFGPDIYSIQAGGGTQTLVEAFTAEGEQMWQTTLSRSSVSNVPDGSGGVIVTEACDSSNPSGFPMTMIDFDGVSGTPLWQTQITSNQNACPAGPPLTAIRQDGSLVIAGPLQASPALLFVGGTTLAPTIPSSTLTDQFGDVSSCDCYSPVGPPMVDSDDSVYVEYEVREIPYPPTTISSALWLLRVAPDGSTNATQLASSNKANLWPGQIIPDGHGGVLATWVIDTITLPAAPYPYQGSYVSMGQVSTYNMPMAPTTIQRGPNSLPILLPLLVGENGTAFVSYGTNIVSFSFAGGAANWNYQAASPASLVSYSNGGGLVAKVTSGGTDTVVRLDSAGNALADTWSASDIDYASEKSKWFGALPASGVADFSAQPVDPTPSMFPAPVQQLSNRALTISVKLNFVPLQHPVNGKTPGDNLHYMPTDPPVTCSEAIGLTDCTPFPPNTGYYAWNLEGNAVVTDDASNWTVTQMRGPIHASGSYLAYGSQVTQLNCAVSGTPWLPDGPLQSHIQQPGGQLSIFYLDAPATYYEVDSATGCHSGFAPLISYSFWENFEVTFQNKITNFSRTIPFYVHLVVTSGGLDRTQSQAKYGRLP